MDCGDFTIQYERTYSLAPLLKPLNMATKLMSIHLNTCVFIRCRAFLL